MRQNEPRFSNLSRRSMLALSGLVGSSVMLGSPSLEAAIDPIKRNGKPKFKFSLAAYSYRSLLNVNSPKLTMSDFISDCARFQLDGTELTSYYFPDAKPAYIRQLKRECFQAGLSVSGTAVGNDFGHGKDDPKRKQQIDHVKHWIDNAEILGAPVIRIFAGHAKKRNQATETHKLMVSAIEECCEYAGEHGVHLALENHGGPTSTAEGLMKFVRDVKSPWFGVNLDTGNFHSDKIYEEIEAVSPYALNVQVKVTVSGPDRKKRPSDYSRLATILRKSGYRGFIVLEYEEGGDPREESLKHLQVLREAFA